MGLGHRFSNVEHMCIVTGRKEALYLLFRRTSQGMNYRRTRSIVMLITTSQGCFSFFVTPHVSQPCLVILTGLYGGMRINNMSTLLKVSRRVCNDRLTWAMRYAL